jgi:AcrR family transcriptional regulator
LGTSDRIERERQAKRTLIIDAARELFLERGYDAVTLRSVAQRIEHSTTAVYVHFKDKRDLIEQMVREDFAKFDAALLEAAQERGPLERLERLGRQYMNFALTLPRHYQLMFLAPRPAGEPASPSADNPVGLDGYSLLLQTVEACIREGVFRPELGDARAVAQAVWAAVHGLVSLLIVMGDVPYFEWRPPQQLMDTLMGSLVRGMATRDEPLGKAADCSGAAVEVAATAPAGKRAAAAPKAGDPKRATSASRSRDTGRRRGR